ncbi:MAG: ABC transporter permease [bacterium]
MQKLKKPSWLFPLAAFTALLLLWQTLVQICSIPIWILPSPTAIAYALWDARMLLLEHTTQTVLEAFLGLCCAIIAGVFVATLIEWSEILRRTMYPFLIISQTIPMIALAPLLIIWFGFGIAPKIIVIALTGFFPIAINLIDGFRLVNPEMLHLMRTMGASKKQIFTVVKVPASLPFFFSGVRIAATYSIIGAVIAEWLGATNGLGVMLTRSAKSYMTDRVFAIIVVISLLSLVVITLVEIAARTCIPWHYKLKKE